MQNFPEGNSFAVGVAEGNNFTEKGDELSSVVHTIFYLHLL
jgi:hypothetical protein